MTGRAATTFLLLALVAIGGCGRGRREAGVPAEQKGEIVRVGNVALTGEDLDKLIPVEERIPPTIDEKKQFVRRWVDTEVLYQEALRRGLKNDRRVQVRLADLEEQFLADYLVFTELEKRTNVGEDEIEAYFAAHEREYMNEYRVSHILVNTPEEARQVQLLLKKKDFAWVADHYSVDPVAKRGGDLGYLTKGNMIPELEGIVFDMKPGDVSGIVKSDFGYHIFKLVDAREAMVAVGLDDVREQIMNTLLVDKRKKAYDTFLDSLKASASIKYRDKEFVPGAPAPAAADTTGLDEEPDTTVAP
jgi:peptidyl-prolyl cis-trans isomerase C